MKLAINCSWCYYVSLFSKQINTLSWWLLKCAYRLRSIWWLQMWSRHQVSSNHHIEPTMTAAPRESHDDVINGNIFRVIAHLCGEFTGNRWIPLTKASDVFFDLRLNKRLSKQSWWWWFETPSRPVWRHRNDVTHCVCCYSQIRFDGGQ